jgi:hypothetical protein
MNRYAITAINHNLLANSNDYPGNSDIFAKFVDFVNSQIGYNKGGTINAIPIIVYHKLGYDSSSSSSNDASSSSSSNAMHFQQGTATSAPDPLPGHHMHQLVMILPPRDDGKVYTGTLTFVASKKVEVVVLHRMTNDTAIPDKFAQPLDAVVPPDNTTMVAISLITPNYGTTPAPSYSIPFSGNALALHTLSGEPFSTSYTVSYQLGKPQIVNNVEATTAANNNSASSNGSSGNGY